MKNLLYISLLLLSVSIVSCKKETEEEEPAANAVITINTPNENEVYAYGDTVKITGTIAADAEMHGYNVRLVNLSSGMNILNQGYHEHGSSFIVNESWKNSVSDTTQMKIIIDAAIDHEGNLTTKERIITCYPQ